MFCNNVPVLNSTAINYNTFWIVHCHLIIYGKMPVVYQGFLIYGLAPGKLIGCEVDLPSWFDYF